MKELIIEFGNDTLGETRIYPRNLKGYEQAVKDLKLYKAQQKAEIEYLKAQITAECQEHQEAMQVADKIVKDATEQNKRVLEKLELIVRSNQELESKLAITEKALELMAQYIKKDLKYDDTEDEVYKYFKELAVKELNNEKNS